MVKERDGRARPFFIEDNDFGADPDNFYDPDYNNIAPRISAVYQLTNRTVLRAGYGHFYGPGQFEDRIQPIENFIERRRVQSTDVPPNTLAYPVDPAVYRNLLSVRGYTHERPDEYNVQYGASVSQELPYEINLTVGYTGSRGKDMFLARCCQHVQRQPRPSECGRRAGRLQDVRMPRRADDQRQSDFRMRLRRIRCLPVERNQAVPRRAQRRRSVTRYSRNKGTTQGSNEAVTASNTFDFESEYGTNQSDIPHTVNASLIYMPPWQGALAGGWRFGGILNARSGVPINVTINRPDTVTVGGVTVVNIPGGNTRGTQRPDLVPGINPYLDQGVRWLNPAAFAAPLPGTFGNLPRNFLRGPSFAQLDLMISKELRFNNSQGIQLRVDLFNITNRLNYENPAAVLPAGTVGQPFTDGTAGTFGYMLGPLNRTVGLGTARQTQLSIRYLF